MSGCRSAAGDAREELERMKIDFTQGLTTLGGEPLERTIQACENCGRPVETSAMTLRRVCINALLTQTRDERNLPGEKKARRYKLALQISNEDVVDLPPKDVALIQELVGTLYTALVVGQVWEMLDLKHE
jgi:hypothetical protein